jgi:anaerobic selenocysteine-containing dehydrogenase
MENEVISTRRQFIKLGGAALAAIPLLILSEKAGAATNAGMRGAMKYQDKPNTGKACADCMQFVSVKTNADLGGCKLFQGDTEVSPTGYCVAWTAKPK